MDVLPLVSAAGALLTGLAAVAGVVYYWQAHKLAQTGQSLDAFSTLSTVTARSLEYLERVEEWRKRYELERQLREQRERELEECRQKLREP